MARTKFLSWSILSEHWSGPACGFRVRPRQAPGQPLLPNPPLRGQTRAHLLAGCLSPEQPNTGLPILQLTLLMVTEPQHGLVVGRDLLGPDHSIPDKTALLFTGQQAQPLPHLPSSGPEGASREGGGPRRGRVTCLRSSSRAVWKPGESDPNAMLHPSLWPQGVGFTPVPKPPASKDPPMGPRLSNASYHSLHQDSAHWSCHGGLFIPDSGVIFRAIMRRAKTAPRFPDG